ncbi:MAG: hypothetical protein A2756_04140 [Candidatus Ryanbacteria bacterium RIFCSPHIGHO2_01_FULL_48_27]|nr:MAG: hypothetical protein A2756_04140 [Candidatus Ryanbacteria bacterium RIFCSPHIGHO2_01_FULL_48_27]
MNSPEGKQPLTRHTRIDTKLHKALKILAAERGVSMVRVINDLLSQNLETTKSEMAQSDK